MNARRATLLLSLAHAAATSLAQAPTPEKYPLHLHILAVDDTHRTRRMQPNWCAGSAPDALSGGDTSPCSASGSTSLGGGDDDFSGAGRGDLVAPPDGITGLDFTYEGCSRLRVAPGFTALPARWARPGARLEVELPNDSTDTKAHPQHCTLKVVPQQFVYLRLRNRAIIRVTQQAYASKPSLRAFLSGGPETLVRRPPAPASLP